MSIPPEILESIEKLTQELDYIERQVNTGLALASQLLERFPNNATLIGLAANLGNATFFVSNFRNRIERVIGEISSSSELSKAMREAGEELSEMWGRVQECKMMVSNSVGILEGLQ
jgi:hypothetical protein